MRWVALLLVCVGLALAYAIGELVPGGGTSEPEAEPSLQAGTEPEEPEAGAAPAPPGPPRPEKVAAATPSGSESNLFYQYVDSANQVQFARSLEEVPEEWRDRAGRVSLPTARPATPAGKQEAGREHAPAPAVRHHEGTFSAARSEERAEQPDIEIYTMKSCGYCRAAMAYMDKRGLEYTNRDIDEEPEAREEYLEKTNGRTGVPVIDIEGEIMQGWNRQHFETVLASMR